MFQKGSDTVAQFILDEINSTKSPNFADLFLVFINDFELGNSIGSFVGQSKLLAHNWHTKAEDNRKGHLSRCP